MKISFELRPTWWSHAAMFAGIACVAAGAYMAWRPLGFIVAGAMLIGIAFTIDRESEKNESR